MEKGEKSNSYFLKLEQRNQTSNAIQKLTQDGNTVYGSNAVLSNFYESLYQSNNIDDRDIDDYIENAGIPTLDDDSRNMLDTFPSIMECADAVKKMKNNKSPGCDCLPIEFYKLFSNDTKHYYYNSIKRAFEVGEMSFTQRMFVLSLLHKKGDRSNISNYRPSTLTNCDYKIHAFVMANRLQVSIDDLVNKDQTAYVKGRYIGVNARLVLDIFEYCEHFDKEGVLLFLDFHKAFDSVEWSFIFKVLEKINFGESFIKWIKLMYTNPLFRVKNNGWLSKSCKMSKGIRQGCQDSALIFILVTEILSMKIKQCDGIKGFEIPDLSFDIKILQHADTTLTLADKNSVKNAIEVVNMFSSVSGIKLNIDKTEGILLGPLKDRYDKLHGVRMTNSAVKTLGIYISVMMLSNAMKKIGFKEFKKWRNY